MDETNVNDELASINVVTSPELAEQANEGRDLVRLQEDIQQSIDRVAAVKEVLGEAQPKDVNQLFGNIVDRQLERVGVRSFGDDPSVSGLENLGYGMTPQQYLDSRLAGCESFLSEFADWSKNVTRSFFSDIIERLASLREDHDSLAKKADALTVIVNDRETVFPKDLLSLGAANRVLLMNGSIPADLVAQVNRFTATTRAITTNFYRLNQANSNEIISFFGGFVGLSEDDARNRLLMAPKALSKYQFKEAMFQVKEESNNVYQTRGSVELLGGRRYYNSFLLNRDPLPDFNSLSEWLEIYRKHECVELRKGDHANEGELQVKGLDREAVSKALKMIKGTLRDVETLFKEGDRYLVNGDEYRKLLAVVKDGEWGDEVKAEIINSFTSLIMTRNSEQVKMRSDVVRYSTLVMMAVMNVCDASMERSNG
ncbi:hypothetical protein [Vibrio phage phiKT1028]|nr:hypothetical protein [Vibrio phage phiKT1028]